MAVLEKIRERNVFLTIIIGLALFLFIITLAGGTGQQLWQQVKNFTGGNAAIKVGGQSIDIQDFGAELDRFNKMQDNSNQDAGALRSEFASQLAMQMSLLDECDELGIKASDAEMSLHTVGAEPSQPIQQLAQTYRVEPQALYELVKKPDQYEKQNKMPKGSFSGSKDYADLKDSWDYAVDMTEKQIRISKLGMLAMSLMQPSAVELKQLAEDNGTTFDVEVARKDYASLDDKDFKVTDADLKSVYDQYKSLFKLDAPSRLVHYIVLDIVPSNNDLAEADSIVKGFYKELADKPGLTGIAASGDLATDSLMITAKEAKDTTMKSVIALSEGGTMMAPRQGFVFTMYKNLGTVTAPDSIVLQQVQFLGDKAAQDTVLKQLNSGADVAALAQKYGPDKMVVQDNSQPLRPAQLANFSDSLRNVVYNAGNEFFVAVSNEQGAAFMKVVSKTAPQTFYKVGRSSYTCTPSTATGDDLHAKLQSYLSANTDLKKFENEDAAKKAGLQLESAVISSNEGSVMGVPDSYNALKWAFDNKPGKISPILEVDRGNKIMAIAVDEKYEDYRPVTDPQVKEFLTQRVLADKKGDKLMKELGKKNSLAEYAAAMDVKTDTIHVTFGGVDNMGTEAGLVGRIAGAKGTGLQPLFKGQQAVYAYNIVKADKSERQLAKPELEQAYGNAHRGFNLQNAFRNARKIKINLIDFYQAQ